MGGDPSRRTTARCTRAGAKTERSRQRRKKTGTRDVEGKHEETSRRRLGYKEKRSAKEETVRRQRGGQDKEGMGAHRKPTERKKVKGTAGDNPRVQRVGWGTEALGRGSAEESFDRRSQPPRGKALAMDVPKGETRGFEHGCPRISRSLREDYEDPDAKGLTFVSRP